MRFKVNHPQTNPAKSRGKELTSVKLVLGGNWAVD